MGLTVTQLHPGLATVQVDALGSLRPLAPGMELVPPRPTADKSLFSVTLLMVVVVSPLTLQTVIVSSSCSTTPPLVGFRPTVQVLARLRFGEGAILQAEFAEPGPKIVFAGSPEAITLCVQPEVLHGEAEALKSVSLTFWSVGTSKVPLMATDSPD